MCKYSPALMVLFVLVLGVGAAQAVTYDQNIYLFHEGSNDPATESNLWTLNSGSNPAVVSKGPGSETISATTYDYWFTADNGTGGSETLYYTESITPAQALNPWTLRGRIRSAGTTATDQYLALYDGTNRWGVWIYDTKLENINSGRTLLTNTNMTSDYRELEMLYKPITAGSTNSNDLLEIYLDQSLVASYTRSSTFASSLSPAVYFGGNSSAGTGRVNWNRIELVQGATIGFAQAVPAPEPSSLALLALGAIGVMRRRSRKQSGQ